jgi:hypothetical protein
MCGLRHSDEKIGELKNEKEGHVRYEYFLYGTCIEGGWDNNLTAAPRA